MIGQGTFGRVYRGLDQRLDRPVAVKVIKPWWTEDPEWSRRFEREAQLMARVNHPGIVQIYDIGYAEEGLYYVAELVEGESLAERLRRGALAPAEALDVAEQLCRALAQAHAQRVVHRDVKPANVLLARDGRVKVGDFGIARLAEGTSEGPADTVVGTPRYMAPEQARGRAPTPATDVYGVGIVLYEMLAGRPPFNEGSAVELALRHLSDPPPPLPARTPPALVEIVERALAKEPGERYPTAYEMADALARARGAVVADERAADRLDPPVREQPADQLEPSIQEHPETVAPVTVARAAKAPDPTRVRSRMTPRRVVNPSESRRYRALLGSVLVVVLALIAAALLSASGTVRVPSLHGLNRARVSSKLQALGLHATFGARDSAMPAGLAIAQSAAPGARVSDGATVRVILSTGPPPVPVPPVVGQQLSAAQTILSRVGLAATASQVAAPGVTPGLVVQQSPAATSDTPPHSAVALEVAETPRWRPLTSFAADGDGHSVPFQIRGSRWRVVYNMGYDGTCTLIFWCSGPSAQVTNLKTGSITSQFGLNEGGGQTRVFDSGPGVYEIDVTSGSDSAHWSIQVQDDY
jgi:eukaryotic-like serine/threonine-protein kinase